MDDACLDDEAAETGILRTKNELPDEIVSSPHTHCHELSIP